jgi:hypothetical protein
VQKVRAFVERGGYVFSSDWALSNTLARAFPEVLGTNSRTGPDETHTIRPPAASAAHPLLRDLFELNPWAAAKRTFTWQVDGSSDLVRPNRKLVVLVDAVALRAKTGSGIVACTFAFTAVGGGTVVPEEVASRPLAGRPLTGGGTRQRGRRNRRERSPRIGRVLHVLSHFQHQKEESGDGFALQQLLLNFVVEKQEAIMAREAGNGPN